MKYPKMHMKIKSSRNPSILKATIKFSSRIHQTFCLLKKVPQPWVDLQILFHYQILQHDDTVLEMNYFRFFAHPMPKQEEKDSPSCLENLFTTSLLRNQQASELFFCVLLFTRLVSQLCVALCLCILGSDCVNSI